MKKEIKRKLTNLIKLLNWIEKNREIAISNGQYMYTEKTMFDEFISVLPDNIKYNIEEETKSRYVVYFWRE